jgi:hypothetical protein
MSSGQIVLDVGWRAEFGMGGSNFLLPAPPDETGLQCQDFLHFLWPAALKII